MRVKVTSRKIIPTEQFLRATCNFFQASRIKNQQTDWAIDKLSKNLFELLIFNLFEFLTFKDVVGMYKIK